MGLAGFIERAFLLFDRVHKVLLAVATVVALLTFTPLVLLAPFYIHSILDAVVQHQISGSKKFDDSQLMIPAAFLILTIVLLIYLFRAVFIYSRGTLRIILYLISALIIVPFTFASYYAIDDYFYDCVIGAKDKLDYIYFSYTAYTTVGFGDLRPAGDCRFYAVTEALFGYLFLGLFIAFVMDWIVERRNARKPASFFEIITRNLPGLQIVKANSGRDQESIDGREFLISEIEDITISVEQHDGLEKEFRKISADEYDCINVEPRITRINSITLPALPRHHSRRWRQCKVCGRLAFYDQKTGDKLPSAFKMPCGHLPNRSIAESEVLIVLTNRKAASH